MDHEKLGKLLVLSLHGAIRRREKAELEQHLRECASCRSRLEELQRVDRWLQAGLTEEPPEEVLREERRRLAEKLRRGQTRARGFPGVLRPGAGGLLQAAVSILVLLGAGLLAGYWIFSPAAAEEWLASEQLSQRDLVIRNVSFLPAGPASDTVEVSFDLARRVRLQGSVHEPRIQTVLAYALINEQNPGVRLRVVEALGGIGSQVGDREVRAALIGALKTDENAAVRERALAVLARDLAVPEVRSALLHVLQHDANPRLRIEAINLLATRIRRDSSLEPEVREVLQEKIRLETNDYVRLRAQALLQEVSTQ